MMEADKYLEKIFGFDYVVEQKGLGRKLGEDHSLPFGPFSIHEQYANLVTNKRGFNVSIHKSPPMNKTIELVRGSPIISQVYLFPEFVSEEEARRMYEELS